MNKQLQKKLLSYSALATALLSVEKSADAQIVYTRINPPDTFTAKQNYASYYLDLNNDGIKDFEFILEAGEYSSDNEGYNSFLNREGSIKALDGNKVGADTAENYNDSICNNKWQSYGSLGLYHHKKHINGSHTTSTHYAWGYFAGETDKYIPLKLMVDTTVYYGWARITMNLNGSTLLLTGYAYDSVANECTTAGDTTSKSSSIAPSPSNDKLSVWSYNKNIHIKLYDENLIGSNVDIYNEIGEKVFSALLTSLQTDIELNNLPNGVYIVRIVGQKSTITKKIVVD